MNLSFDAKYGDIKEYIFKNDMQDCLNVNYKLENVFEQHQDKLEKYISDIASFHIDRLKNGLSDSNDTYSIQFSICDEANCKKIFNKIYYDNEYYKQKSNIITSTITYLYGDSPTPASVTSLHSENSDGNAVITPSRIFCEAARGNVTLPYVPTESPTNVADLNRQRCNKPPGIFTNMVPLPKVDMSNNIPSEVTIPVSEKSNTLNPRRFESAPVWGAPYKSVNGNTAKESSTKRVGLIKAVNAVNVGGKIFEYNPPKTVKMLHTVNVGGKIFEYNPPKTDKMLHAVNVGGKIFEYNPPKTDIINSSEDFIVSTSSENEEKFDNSLPLPMNCAAESTLMADSNQQGSKTVEQSYVFMLLSVDDSKYKKYQQSVLLFSNPDDSSTESSVTDSNPRRYKHLYFDEEVAFLGNMKANDESFDIANYLNVQENNVWSELHGLEGKIITSYSTDHHNQYSCDYHHTNNAANQNKDLFLIVNVWKNFCPSDCKTYSPKPSYRSLHIPSSKNISLANSTLSYSFIRLTHKFEFISLPYDPCFIEKNKRFSYYNYLLYQRRFESVPVWGAPFKSVTGITVDESSTERIDLFDGVNKQNSTSPLPKNDVFIVGSNAFFKSNTNDSILIKLKQKYYLFDIDIEDMLDHDYDLIMDTFYRHKMIDTVITVPHVSLTSRVNQSTKENIASSILPEIMKKFEKIVYYEQSPVTGSFIVVNSMFLLKPSLSNDMDFLKNVQGSVICFILITKNICKTVPYPENAHMFHLNNKAVCALKPNEVLFFNKNTFFNYVFTQSSNLADELLLVITLDLLSQRPS